MPLVVVLDSNVFIASLLNSESCGAILAEWRKGTFDVAISSALLGELRRTLARRKFHGRIHPNELSELIRFIEDTAVRTRSIRLHRRISRDPTDDEVFACAFAAGATCIVSGDADVLTVAPISGLRVLSPRSFLAQLKSR